jgi:hypothetical protein
MDEKYEQNVGVKEMVVQLLSDNIKLQAELAALKKIFEGLLLQIQPDADPKKLQEAHMKLVEAFAMKIVADHPLYSDYWKKQLKDLDGLGASF